MIYKYVYLYNIYNINILYIMMIKPTYTNYLWDFGAVYTIFGVQLQQSTFKFQLTGTFWFLWECRPPKGIWCRISSINSMSCPLWLKITTSWDAYIIYFPASHRILFIIPGSQDFKMSAIRSRLFYLLNHQGLRWFFSQTSPPRL